MIKNIIFDMGNVLIRFDRQELMERAGIAPEDRKLVNDRVFSSVEWVRLDRGSMTEPEAADSICRRLPERLQEKARRLVCHWDELVEPIEGVAELIYELKEKGYRLFLLSNISRRQREYWPRIPGSECFEGCLLSAEEGIMKPDDRIYSLILSRFSLAAEECVFIDDAPQNIEASQRNGIAGIMFYGDAQELRKELSELGIDV